MSYENKYQPKGLEKPDGDHIAITWGDGETRVLAMNFLRANCPCADCVDEWTGEVKVDADAVAHVRLKSMNQLGTYAFGILFDDGHDTGIFSFKKLRDWGDDNASAS